MPKPVNHNATAVPVLILDVQYLPSIPYFVAIARSEKILLDIHEHFIKQTYRNRCRILTANGTDDLVIPVKRPHQQIPVHEIRIDNGQHWAKNHWKSIQSAYGNSPWFHHYDEDFKSIILSKHEFLKDINLMLLKQCLKILGINTRIDFTVKYEHELKDIMDFRSVIHPKRDYDNLSFYKPVSYIQNFGVNFVRSLSAIDLIFNTGPDSGNLILQSIRS